jgi:hypothetical protein
MAAPYTQLSPMATPGRRYSFTAKTAAATPVPGMEYAEPDNRLQWSERDNRVQFSEPDNRLQFSSRGTD